MAMVKDPMIEVDRKLDGHSLTQLASPAHKKRKQKRRAGTAHIKNRRRKR